MSHSRIEEIVWCERRAGELAQDAEGYRKQAGLLISEELNSGRSYSEVAGDISDMKRGQLAEEADGPPRISPIWWLPRWRADGNLG